MKKISKGLTANTMISRGFTLIELLIVIGIIGVLAAVILVAIDPVEQLARARDAGRKSSVAQLGRALQAYYTNNSAYPLVGGWTSDPTTNALVLSGDIRTIPVDPPPGAIATACSGVATTFAIENNFCYKVDAASASPNVVVYIHLESKSEKNKGAGACAGDALKTWYVYASNAGRSGVVCQAAEPLPTDSFTFF